MNAMQTHEFKAAVQFVSFIHDASESESVGVSERAAAALHQRRAENTNKLGRKQTDGLDRFARL